MTSEAGEENTVTAPAPNDPAVARAGIQESHAERVMVEAMKSYELAELVHQRSVVGSIDSATLAYKSLSMLLELLLELHGEQAPSEPEELLRRANAVMETRGLATAGLGDELMLILRMRASFLEAGRAPSIADGRRYDRAFLRLREVFEGLESELGDLRPGRERGLVRYLRPAALLLLGFVVGIGAGSLIARKSASKQQAQQQSNSTPPALASADNTPAFSTTFYRDQDFRDLAFTRKDRSLAFDWAEGAPPGLDQVDHFSVRWTGTLHVPQNGEFDLFLTSDDGSRLFIDDRLVVDNWGQHTAVTKEARITLSAGAHPIRLDYFDYLGQAIVRLEWSSDRFPRRVISSNDLR